MFGAYFNVLTNLKDITDPAFKDQVSRGVGCLSPMQPGSHLGLWSVLRCFLQAQGCHAGMGRGVFRGLVGCCVPASICTEARAEVSQVRATGILGHCGGLAGERLREGQWVDTGLRFSTVSARPASVCPASCRRPGLRRHRCWTSWRPGRNDYRQWP